MKDKRVVFMGTPSYSVPVLEMLIENTTVVGVVTQPDKYVGRKKILTPCPVKEKALENNIPVFSPSKLKEEYKEIFKFEPDIIITCAYGQMIPEELINYPKYKIVNVHASLLPKYRGGAPIERAIMNGEKETGITIMYTDKGMDSGDIIEKKIIPILEEDNYTTLSNKMSYLGASFLKEVLPSIFENKNKREKQDEDKKTFARIITREDEHISFNDKSINVYNKIRALSEKPGGYIILDDKNIKVYKSTLDGCGKTDKKPGTITRTDKEGIYVSCLDTEIKLLEIQLPGKNKVLVKDYLNGVNNLEGKVFL